MQLALEIQSTGIRSTLSTLYVPLLFQRDKVAIARTPTLLFGFHLNSPKPRWTLKIPVHDRDEPYGDDPFTVVSHDNAVWFDRNGRFAAVMSNRKHGFEVHGIDTDNGRVLWHKRWLPPVSPHFGKETRIDGDWHLSSRSAWFGASPDDLLIGFTSETFADRGQDIDGETWIRRIDPATGEQLGHTDTDPASMTLKERRALSVFVDGTRVTAHNPTTGKWEEVFNLPFPPDHWAFDGKRVVTIGRLSESTHLLQSLNVRGRPGFREKPVEIPGKTQPLLIATDGLIWISPKAGGALIVRPDLSVMRLDKQVTAVGRVWRISKSIIAASGIYLWLCDARDGSLLHSTKDRKRLTDRLPGASMRNVLLFPPDSRSTELLAVDSRSGTIAKVRLSSRPRAWPVIHGHTGLLWSSSRQPKDSFELFWFRVYPD